jgi:nitrous oxidase accessory protein NosD
MSTYSVERTTTHRLRRLVAGVAGLAMASLVVSAAAATLCVKPSGGQGCSSTIGAAVSAASPGDVIQVWPGVYTEQVMVTKSVALISMSPHGAIIDATHLANGIWVDGMSAAPSAGVANVVISGFTVRKANFEGILLTNVTNVTLDGNEVMDNDQSLDSASGTCPGLPAFETSEGDDCGEGIHLMGADHSTLVHNEVEHNSGGILTSDETGPSVHNLISENSVHDNVFDCGITLASHPPAAVTGAHVSFGVGYNTISHNASVRNGTQTPGAGVGIFAPSPGTSNTGNVVIDNDIRDNGATGVAMHNHAAPPTAPAVNLNDNVIVGNRFSGNGPDNPGAPTAGPTGINIFSAGLITGTVVSENSFDKEAIDVAFSAPNGQVNVHFNDFSAGIGVDNMGAGTVDATENWWNCPSGPNHGRCATVQGSGVADWPWLTQPFEDERSAGEHGHD